LIRKKVLSRWRLLAHYYTAAKVFYYLLQIAHLIFQLVEKGSLFRQAFPNGVGSLKNIAFRLLEAWRNLQFQTLSIRQGWQVGVVVDKHYRPAYNHKFEMGLLPWWFGVRLDEPG
jgi:hypothetical protein